MTKYIDELKVYFEEHNTPYRQLNINNSIVIERTIAEPDYPMCILYYAYEMPYVLTSVFKVLQFSYIEGGERDILLSYINTYNTCSRWFRIYFTQDLAIECKFSLHCRSAINWKQLERLSKQSVVEAWKIKNAIEYILPNRCL